MAGERVIDGRVEQRRERWGVVRCNGTALCVRARGSLVSGLDRSPCPEKQNANPEVGVLVNLVGRAGVEPATNGLKVRCSTNRANDPVLTKDRNYSKASEVRQACE